MTATMTSPFTFAEAKGALPVLGHVGKLLRDPRGFLMSLPDQGDLVRIRLGTSRAYLVCNAELTHQVLVNDRVFDKGGPFVDRLREFIGESVSTCPRGEHRRQRRLMQPAFHPNRLTHYAELMKTETVVVTNSWQHGQVLDVYAAMQAITTKIAARTMFAAPASAALIEDAYDALNEIMTGAGKRMLIPPPLDKLPTRSKIRYDRARKRIREITDQLISDYRAAGVDHQDLMSMLLARDEDGGALSEEEISNQVVTLFLGGVETVASTLGWALCVLALHPEIQDRLHAEVDAIGPSPTLEDLAKMPYAKGIISESLRMYPPGWLLTRMTTKDSMLGGVHIPAGSTVIYSPFLLGNRSDLFDDPDRFDPDRHAKRPVKGSFVPFGEGPRKCIGDTFTMVEAPLVLALIAAKWRVEPAGTRIRPLERMSLLLTPRDLKVRLVARDDF
ncbi:cytochrome P450 [Kibdelosporangium aridum]|uniref:Pentalenene oxygenase n=1 Tax=Kibdelosporangium aridum TaxID=2030 RepID=A0A1W2AIA1_KIBAR|nr:cytochrome P450 [Kibdelosporangium aridum]SMC59988.1 pentalenene oxygenase [Kibdelosporangium aridum]